ncbi:MAG: hypothetical protein QM426_07810 [Euryarchaeota archaeon]|nr:hypothetical protein [Euryarchaeota archaeon]
MLFSADLENLSHGYWPVDPERDEGLVRQATAVIRDKMYEGGGIVVH